MGYSAAPYAWKKATHTPWEVQQKSRKLLEEGIVYICKEYVNNYAFWHRGRTPYYIIEA